jgi:hypothetical protein
LYEGYLLYPYRASAVKNQQQSNVGVTPPQVTGDAAMMRTACFVEGEDPYFDIRMRFPYVIAREVQALRPSRRGVGPVQYEQIPSLAVAGRVYRTWQEACERKVVVDGLPVIELCGAPTASLSLSSQVRRPRHRTMSPVVRSADFLRRQELMQGEKETLTFQLAVRRSWLRQ